MYKIIEKNLKKTYGKALKGNAAQRRFQTMVAMISGIIESNWVN